MQIINGSLVFSPSDLQKFVECDHLTRLQVQVCGGKIQAPERQDEGLELLRKKGLEHEHAWLERLSESGRAIHVIPNQGDWNGAALQTEKAMRDGADVIYQGVLQSGNWRGVADFLTRVEGQTALGPWAYEAWDTKLARHGKPSYVLQLALYCREIERIQGQPPSAMHVVLGTSEKETFRPSDFGAYFRRLQQRLTAFANTNTDTYPYPVAHCRFCDFDERCKDQWTRDDHLSQVAYIRRDQARKLEAVGIRTVESFSQREPPIDVRIAESTQRDLLRQARLQHNAKVSGRNTFEVLPPEDERGFSLLPLPDEGDLYFDIEGYPFFEAVGGLEYLFGTLWSDGGATRFNPLWASDRISERRMFEAFVDFVRDRLRQRPNLHIYHYANYEVRALKELMQRYGTREEELDDLLRRELFIDLFRVVRQTIRISYDSYSLKSIRRFFMPDAGQGAVTGGEESIVQYAKWLETGDQAILNAIERYNEEDCLSTLRLRDWLIERKQEAEATLGLPIAWRPQSEKARAPIVAIPDPYEDLRARLRAQSADLGGEAVVALMSNLLGYHKREAKPSWWAYYDRLESSLAELLENTEAIAGLAPVEAIRPKREKQSIVYTLSFPEQEHKLTAGLNVIDPRTGRAAGSIVSLDSRASQLELKRGPTLADEALPAAIISGEPIPTHVKDQAVERIVSDIVRVGFEKTLFHAAAAVLRRTGPSFKNRPAGGRVQTLDLGEQRRLTEDLRDSYLFIQGPPGSGKTWTGARLITYLIDRGFSVGVAAHSHKAIHNLLKEVESVAVEDGLEFVGLKKSTGSPESEYEGPFIRSTTSNEACEDPAIQLVAGTSWLFSRPQMEGLFDFLFLDEAGQISLADGLAISTSARNLVLLGDPQQLPHISQGVHAAGSSRSVLEHLLGDQLTVREEDGLFLARSWRMHPDVCKFVSELSYEGRLESAEHRERQRVTSLGLTGAGVRYLSVNHSGNAQQSIEEARVVAAESRQLLQGGTYTNFKGETARLTAADILVVAPYNMQVHCLREHVPDGIEVGTVDKFQGREAPIVFFSMATSDGGNIPRNLDFLFSRNRLNVAISRAKCLAVIVACPRLLDVSCRTVDQMRLVNGLCRFVELADEARPQETLGN